MDTVVVGDDAEDVRTLEVARARLLALREDWSYGTLMVFSPFGFIYASGEPQNLTEAARFFPENASGIEDACVGDALVFLRIMPVPEPASVQAMNLDGTEVEIFGDVFEHDAVSVRIDLSRGQIACSPGPKRVVTSFNDGSLIHAYDYSGAPEWVAHLAGFLAPEVRGVSFGDGRIALSSPGESPEDRVQRLMREHGLLAPVRRGHPCGDRTHSGRIRTERPDELWGTDASRFWTKGRAGAGSSRPSTTVPRTWSAGTLRRKSTAGLRWRGCRGPVMRAREARKALSSGRLPAVPRDYLAAILADG